jgi:hypothetical protein
MIDEVHNSETSVYYIETKGLNIPKGPNFRQLCSQSVFSSRRWGGSSTQAWMPTYVSILRISQMIWVWRATVEWHWQGKPEELGEKPVPVPLCPPQISHGLTRARTRASAVTGRQLTTWAMARPCQSVSYTVMVMVITQWRDMCRRVLEQPVIR